MNIIHAGVGAVLVAAALGPVQSSGVLFVQQETRGKQVSSQTMQMDKDHIRAETGSGSDRTVMIFDGTQQVLRMVQPDKKTYTEITKQEMESIRAQMNSAMAAMQQQMANMPAAARKQMEQAMQGRGGMEMPKIQYRQTGAGKAGQWACTNYEGYSGTQKLTEICTVDPSQFGLSVADFAVTRQLVEFLQALVPQAAAGMMAAGTAEQGFAGVPVRTTTFQNGAVAGTTELKEFRKESFPASTFSVPAGFKKEPFADGRGR